ncbi:MAG: hypothetical protein PUD03_07540 [Lachnospiraceae bacterium]|nr:hypothetical protein [Lachnospiraceae bacterium]
MAIKHKVVINVSDPKGHGADKLSDLDKAEYAAVMAEAEVLE